MGKVKNVLKKIHTACKRLETSNNQQLEAVESLVVEGVVEDVNEGVVETVNETIDGAKVETSAENISGRTEVHLFIPEFDYETYDSNIDSTLQEFGLEADMADLYENAVTHEEYGEGTEVIIPVSKNDSRFLDKFTEALEEIGAVGVQIVRPELSSTVKNSLNQINTTTYSRLF
jgi:hypothetical protein